MFYETVLVLAVLVIPISIGLYFLWVLIEERILNRLLNYKEVPGQYAEAPPSLEQRSLSHVYEKTIEKLIDLETRLFRQLLNNEKTQEERFNALTQKLDFLDSKVRSMADKMDTIVLEPPPKTSDRRFKTSFLVR